MTMFDNDLVLAVLITGLLFGGGLLFVWIENQYPKVMLIIWLVMVFGLIAFIIHGFIETKGEYESFKENQEQYEMPSEQDTKHIA